MRRIATILALIMLASVIAACDSEDSSDPLPTVMVLDTEAPQEAEDPTPTEEIAPTNTPEPTATEETVEEEAAAPEETEDIVENLPLPEILAGAGQTGNNNNNNSLPFVSADGTGTWVVTRDPRAPVRECPEADCEVVGRIDMGTELDVVAVNDEWLTIVYETQQVFIETRFVENTSGGAPIPGEMPAFIATPNGENPRFPPGFDEETFLTRQAQQSQVQGTPIPPVGGDDLPAGIQIVSPTPGGIDIQSILLTAEAQENNN